MQIELLRNLGIAAHIDAGKTTLAERILYVSGVERHLGEVEEGTSALDWMSEERERGITISAAATRVPWRGHALNLIDTPGHVDFTIEVERCMRVLDGAVLVLDGVMGVQAQSEAVWRQMRRHGVPALAFVNKLDRPGADYLRCCADITRKLGARAVPIAYPIGAGKPRAVVDLLRGLTYSTRSDLRSVRAEKLPFPADAADEIGVLRAELLELLAEHDEGLTGALLEGREVDVERCVALLRARVITGELVPVLCGAAQFGIGVQHLLDAMVDYLPSPLEAPAPPGLEARDPEGPLALLVFKRQWIARSELCFARIYSGRLRTGEELSNPRTHTRERVQSILRVHADQCEELDQAQVGDIIALRGIDQAATGDTLCRPEQPIVLASVPVPQPVLERVIEPLDSLDRERLRAALALIEREDPSFRVSEDPDTGQWRMEGMGELHLEIAQKRIEQEFQLRVISGAPRVAYQEAPRRASIACGSVDRGQAVEVRLSLEPDPQTREVSIAWEPSLEYPAELKHALEIALESALRSGPRAGYPLTHAHCLIQAASPWSASGPQAEDFAAAAVVALEAALAQAQVEVEEPWMKLVVDTPPEYSSGILADLESRGARVRLVQNEGLRRSIEVELPLAHLFGYATQLRSLSQGRADFSMQLCAWRTLEAAQFRERGLA